MSNYIKSLANFLFAKINDHQNDDEVRKTRTLDMNWQE